MPTHPIPGRSLVTRRAVVDIVRAATLGSYGVTGFAGGGPLGAVLERLGRRRGIRVTLADPVTVELHLTVAAGVPIAEVARQVDAAVRHNLREALGRDVAPVTVHVDGLRRLAADLPAPRERKRHGPGEADRPKPDDLAASGTDVA